MVIPWYKTGNGLKDQSSEIPGMWHTFSEDALSPKV